MPIAPPQAEIPAPAGAAGAAPAGAAGAAPAWAEFRLPRLAQLRPAIEPYPFQDFAVSRGIEASHFVLGMAAGLGKSFCAFQLWEWLKLRQPQARMIVLATKSALHQFRDEYAKFYDAPGVRSLVVADDMPKLGAKTYPEARKLAYARFASLDPGTATHLIVMGYAVFRNDIERILGHVRALKRAGIPVFLVPDEATKFKNMATQLHRAVNETSMLSAKVAPLTATMTKGRLEEIYGIFRGMGIGHVVARNWHEFLKRYCIAWAPKGKPTQAKITGYKNVAEFIERIRPYCIVLRKADVADFLPAFVPRLTLVEHSPEQFELIAGIYRGKVEPPAAAGEEAAGSDPAAPAPTLTLSKLTENGHIKRALLDPRVVTRTDLRAFDEARQSPKTLELLRFMREEATGERCIVYTPSKVYLRLLKHVFRAAHDIDPWYRNPLEISGDVPAALREQYRARFQDPAGADRLLLMTDAGLESLNLQAAEILHVMSMPRRGGDLIQLAGRLSRIGSTHRSLLINYVLTRGSQDVDDYAICQREMQIIAMVLGEAEQGLLDYECLKRRDKVAEGLSDADYNAAALDRVMMIQRRARQALYGVPA